ncbi:MAG: hypothetical protein ACOY3O_09060 [Thermodesulfobacteriota bacterium]
MGTKKTKKKCCGKYLKTGKHCKGCPLLTGEGVPPREKKKAKKKEKKGKKKK